MRLRFRRRFELEEAITTGDPEGTVEEELRRCARSPVHFLSSWGWTYDPRRKKGKTVPFILWPKQEAYVRWVVQRLKRGEVGTVVKPRAIGASWLNAGIGAWAFLFLEDTSIGFSSRKLMYVESKSPDSLFAKVRFILDKLPPLIFPYRMKSTVSPPLMINRLNGTEIKGEGGDEIGRGGRSSLYFVDEFAFYEQQDAVESAVSESADAVIYASTFSAPGNRFHSMTENPEIPCFRFAWTDDPNRDQAWLDRKLATLHRTHVERDILCNPYASLTGQLLMPEWIDAAVSVRLSSAGPMLAGYDPAGSGDCKPMLAFREGPICSRIEEVKGENGDARARRVRDSSSGRRAVYFDVCGGWGEDAKRVLGDRGIPLNGSDAVFDRKIVPADLRERFDRCQNLRAALYWNIRERMHNSWLRSRGEKIPDELCLQIPDDPELRKQLGAIQLEESSSGLMRVESKESMLRRGLPSPDKADALVYAFGDVFRAVKTEYRGATGGTGGTRGRRI